MYRMMEVIYMYKLDEWINKPKEYNISDKRISFKVLPKTDFWQITHYGFSRTDGNCYVKEVNQDVSFTVKVKMNYKEEFDQLGIIVYFNEDNFAKLCVENQLKCDNKLGSVVCKDKRSDWATQSLNNIDELYFRVSKRGVNYLFEYSYDGIVFQQIRLFDISVGEIVNIGVFGASPLGDGFEAEFTNMVFKENKWFLNPDDLPQNDK